jgi:hypothetical protein
MELLMGKLSDQHHVPTVLTQVDVLALRVGGHPKTRHLLAALVAVRDALVVADLAYQQAYRERLAASIELEYLDGEADKAWMDLSRDVNAKVAGNRDSDLWRGLYTEAPHETVEGTVTDHQVQNVERVIGIIETNNTYAEFRPQAARLKAEHEAALEGQKRYKAALAKENALAHQRDLAAHDARRAHNGVKPKLEIIFESTPSMVNAFWG